MFVLLDDKRIEITGLESDATLGALIDSTRAQALSAGRIIFTIRCDGKEVEPDRLEVAMSRPACEFREIALITGDAREAVLDALEKTRAAFVDTFAGVKQAAQDLASGNMARGMAGIVDCVGVWAHVHEAIVSGGPLLGVDFEQLVLRKRHILDSLNDLSAKLRDMKQAIESRDNVLLGDMLRYEMDEMLGGWETMLDGFIEHVRAMGKDAPTPAHAVASQ